MRNNKSAMGHGLAIITIFIWGTTFISTKVLLETFAPVEILFVRFVIGYLALWLLAPRILHIKERKQELYFLAAGLAGVTLYYLLENIALTYSYASNVGVITSVAPFFTAIFTWLVYRGKRPGIRFFGGFAIAILGIGLISFQGTGEIAVNPIGDLLALCASVMWAIYSIIIKKITTFGYSTVLVTRRTFFYGILCMTPALLLMDFEMISPLTGGAKSILNFLFLGILACAICFVTWNFAVKHIGAVKASIYIYAIPVITTIASALILKEQITPMAIAGIALTLVGLFLSNEKDKN